MSHGQASVEPRFSRNYTILTTNMSPETVVSKRMIKDYMLSFNLKPHTRYEIHLEEKKKKQVTEA